MGGEDVPSNGQTTSLMAAAGVGWRDQLSRGREEDAITLIGMLLDEGADINAANQSGDTALHGAALRGSTAIIQYLVDHGADVTARNEKGWLPLDIALGQPEERIPYNEATATLLKQLTPIEVAQAGPEDER
jgi:ankyrin repeat protein